MGGGGSPFIDQDSFRWRYDNGSESAAGWVDVTNSNPAASSFNYDTNYRLRYLLQNTGTKDKSDGYDFQYRIGGASGTWTDITTTSSFVRSVTSGNVTDGDTTTAQIGSGTHDEGYIDTTGTIASFTIVQAQESENELVFQFVKASFSGGEDVEIRMVYDNGSELDAYTNTATITNMTTPPTNVWPIFYSRQWRIAKSSILRR
jgi:hypothetical protein